MAFHDRIHYHSNKFIQLIIILFGVGAFLTAAVSYLQHPVISQAWVFLLFFSGITLILLLCEHWNYTAFFLLSTFTMLTSWRLATLAQDDTMALIYLGMFVFVALQYLITAKNDLKDRKQNLPGIHLSNYEWQLLFVRMYIGYDLVPHFCEKILAGTAIRMEDVNAFIHLGVPHSLFFVLFAGLIEFAGALSLSCGFMTRLGSIALFVYLMVATYLGHHFSLGFIWANPGGGWEYPVLWSILVLSFAWTGANTFSIDEVLNENFKLPVWLKLLMGQTKNVKI